MDRHDYSCLEGPCETYQGSSVRMAEDMHEVKGNSLVATPRVKSRRFPSQVTRPQ